MNAAERVLRHELNQLESNIARLEKSIPAHANGEYKGQEQIIAIQRANHDVVADLLENYAYDPCELLLRCRLRLMKAEQRHSHVANNGHRGPLSDSQKWWDTLGEIQYFSSLYARLSKAVEEENGVGSEVHRKALDSAKARAQQSVERKASQLVRDDPGISD